MDLGELIAFGVGGQPTSWLGPLEAEDPYRVVHVAAVVAGEVLHEAGDHPPDQPAFRSRVPLPVPLARHI